MKNTSRIGVSLALGILVILGALYVRGTSDTAAEGSVAVVHEAVRAPIEVTDANNNGVQDWEESLQGKVFDTIKTPTTTITATEEYVPPTTFTGKFSEAFFQDYLSGKIKGEDFSDPTAFIGTAVQAIEQNTKSKTYSRLELNIVPDSEEAIRAYGNRVSEIMKTYSIISENEAAILQRALTAEDPEILKELEPIRTVYANTIRDSRTVEVPLALVEAHINLLNAYEAILTDIEAMQVAFTDPLYSLARVKGYKIDAQALFNAFGLIASTIKSQNVFYMNDEPGAFFYLFES